MRRMMWREQHCRFYLKWVTESEVLAENLSARFDAVPTSP